MKRILLILVITVQYLQIHAQSRYALPDSIAAVVRGADVSSLHQKLTKNLSANEDKVRAFYSWIANNIQYDVSKSLRQHQEHAKQEPGCV